MQINISNSYKNSVIISDTDINLKETFECGQCFRWNFDGEGYIGVVNGKVLRAIQKDKGFILENTTVEEFENIWSDYFDLKMDYSIILNDFPEDKFLEKAAIFGKGIRILKQNPIETIISFIISANNNIGRIKKIIEGFCYIYGKSIKYQNKMLFC
jgi:N-glycosylase/DNA lyase